MRERRRSRLSAHSQTNQAPLVRGSRCVERLCNHHHESPSRPGGVGAARASWRTQEDKAEGAIWRRRFSAAAETARETADIGSRRTTSAGATASVERAPAVPRAGARLWEAVRERWPQLWPWAPLALAGVYGIVVLVNFSSLITAINMDSDVSIALMIGKLVGNAPHGAQVVLGDHPWYEALWFLRLTSGLPGYRQLWEFAPMLWSLAGIALLSWSAWSVFGRWPAALVASALVCGGTAARFMFFSFDWHGPTALHTVFLGALVVWLAGRARRFATWQLVAIALARG